MVKEGCTTLYTESLHAANGFSHSPVKAIFQRSKERPGNVALTNLSSLSYSSRGLLLSDGYYYCSSIRVTGHIPYFKDRN